MLPYLFQTNTWMNNTIPLIFVKEGAQFSLEYKQKNMNAVETVVAKCFLSKFNISAQLFLWNWILFVAHSLLQQLLYG